MAERVISLFMHDVVSIKFEDEFFHNVEKAMKKHNYTTKTEFIREAVRDKLDELEKRESVLKALRLYGAGRDKHKTITDEKIHASREKAARELAKELKAQLE